MRRPCGRTRRGRAAALAAAFLAAGLLPAAAQTDSDDTARRLQAVQVEMTNRLSAIERSLALITDLVERIHREQRQSGAAVETLTAELRRSLAEMRALGSGAAGVAPGSGAADGTLGVIRVPVDGEAADASAAADGAAGDAQAEQVEALLAAIGELESGAEPEGPPTADAQFDAALDLLRDGFLSDAADRFRAFLDAHGDDPRVPDAHFYLGEAQFGLNRFRAAAETYYTVVQEYSSSSRAPDSVLRIGMILARQGNRDAACRALLTLGEHYPDASERLKARAENEARSAGCPT